MPPSDHEREQARLRMAQMAADPLHKRGFERLLHLAAWKGDHEQVQERLSWGIDPNCSSRKSGRTPLIRAVTCPDPIARAVQVLLAAGADPAITDLSGKSALDYARMRLARFDGKPRKPVRRSRSLTPHGDLKLRPGEHRMLDRLRAMHPDDPDVAEEIYLSERRKAAERTFDVRGNLGLIVPMLERAAKA